MSALTLEQVEALGGYQIVLADPAWLYNQKGRGSAKNHYVEMPIEAIQAMPVPRLAAKNAVLFLWGTWPQLPVVLETMRRWGFEYKTVAFVWVKYHEPSGARCIGGGMWTRSNTEFCLLGVRGEPPRRISKAVRQLIETDEEDKILLAPRQEHSAKPAEARQRIFELMGADLPAIELFARCMDDEDRAIEGGRVAEGWDQWGNQCDADVVLGIEGEKKVDSHHLNGAETPYQSANSNVNVVTAVVESANQNTIQSEEIKSDRSLAAALQGVDYGDE